MPSAFGFAPRGSVLRGWLLCWLAFAAAVCAQAQSVPGNQPSAAPAPVAETQPAPSDQQVLYDRYIKVTVPAEWQEKRSWELGEDRSLPLYNPNTEAVVFVWGFDRPPYRSGYIESLASGDRLSRRLEMDLSLWSAEASRYYAMVSGGFMMRSTAHAVTVGPSLRPGEVHYLGKMKVGRAELDVVEYVSDAKVDKAFANKYKMRPELVGSRAQILFGQATFGHGTQGYTLVACRFTTQAGDTRWVQPLLENVESVGKAEREKGAAAEHIRDQLSHAEAVIQDHRYGQALAQLQAVLEQDPQNDNALILEGEALLHLRKLADAETALQQAIAVNPNSDRAHFLMGAVLWEEEKRDQAVAEWKLVQRISPLYPEIEEVLLQKSAQHPEAATEKQP
jgi:tetratricopeptide (TPR) repeat protein